jgi:exonuclease SbcD
MKILHFADLHLGVESYGRLDPATGLSSRLGDFLAALDQVVDYALNSDIDLVLFCGDAYKSREPSQTHQREFARRLRRLVAAGIPVFLLVGNHDLPNAIARATTMEIFDALEVENITVANRPGTFTIKTGNGTLQIVALPWARRGALLSRDDCKNLTPEQLNQRMEQIMTQQLAAEIQFLDPELPAILAAHVTLSTADAGSEKSMIIGREHILLQSNVAHPAFDYVALGHIHKRQVLSQEPPVVYSGSLAAIDFSDEGEEKGFYVIELYAAGSQGERLLSYRLHQVRVRPFVTIAVNADAENPTAVVLRALARKKTDDAIVRVQIKVPASREAMIQEAEIRKALRDAHFVIITKDVEREHRIRLSQRPAERMTPLETLKAYLESKKTSPERTKVLLEYGERLVRELETQG